MEELYRMIEEKIKSSGFLKPISGRDVYDDICEEIEDKEEGSYLLISKFSDELVFEYTVTIMDNEFNLSVLTIVDGEDRYVIDFDN